MKKSEKIIGLVLKAVALAMGVASIVMGTAFRTRPMIFSDFFILDSLPIKCV